MGYCARYVNFSEPMDHIRGSINIFDKTNMIPCVYTHVYEGEPFRECNLNSVLWTYDLRLQGTAGTSAFIYQCSAFEEKLT